MAKTKKSKEPPHLEWMMPDLPVGSEKPVVVAEAYWYGRETYSLTVAVPFGEVSIQVCLSKDSAIALRTACKDALTSAHAEEQVGDYRKREEVMRRHVGQMVRRRLAAWTKG